MKQTKHRRFLRGKGRAVTLIEMLVAIAIAGIFLAGVLESFVYIIRTAEKSEVELEALTNARAALDIMSREIKSARIDPRRPIQFFHGQNEDLAYGDAIDNDEDGNVDEEIRDGDDNDADSDLPADDQHVVITGAYAEREDLRGFPDLGDVDVDEDCRFSNDILEFLTFPDPDNPGFREKNIRYEIKDFDGQSNVLVKHVTYNPNDPEIRYEEEDPIAFNVLSLSFLYWDPNRIPMNWVTSWDSLYAPMFPDPQLELPVSVHISVTVYAGTDPFQEYQPGDPVETVVMETVINIEQVLKDERYRNLM